MQLLDAAIAFALTIAGLATVVSIIIEIIHRVLSLRSKGLRAMLSPRWIFLIDFPKRKSISTSNYEEK